jgi:hypothetical protein
MIIEKPVAPRAPAAADDDLFAEFDASLWAWSVAYLVSSSTTAYTFSCILLYSADAPSVLHSPLAGFVFTSFCCLAASLAVKYGGFQLEWLGTKELSHVFGKQSLTVGALAAGWRAALSISAQRLPFALSETLHLFAAPVLLLLLPFLGIPRPSFAISCGITGLAVVLGFALHNVEVASTGLGYGTTSFVLHALLLGSIKRWKMHCSAKTPGSILTSYASVGSLVALFVLLTIDVVLPRQEDTDWSLEPLLPNQGAISVFLVSATVEHTSMVNLACRADNLLSIAVLVAPKALLAFLLSPIARGALSQYTLVLLALCAAAGFLAHNLYQHFAEGENESDHLPQDHSLRKHRTLPSVVILLAFLPYTLWTVREISLSHYLSLRPSELPFAGYNSLDIVISYYNEPLDELKEQLEYIRSLDNVMDRKPSIIAYVKGEDVSIPDFRAATGIEEVYTLANKGREGDTYLHHILRNYNASQASPADAWQAAISTRRDRNGGYVRPKGLADQTMFLQNHLSWGWVGRPRMKLLTNTTGYLAFGPYLKGMWACILQQLSHLAQWIAAETCWATDTSLKQSAYTPCSPKRLVPHCLLRWS